MEKEDTNQFKKEEFKNNNDNNFKTINQVNKKSNSIIGLIIVGVVIGVVLSSFFSFSNTNNTIKIQNPFGEILSILSTDAVYGNETAEIIVFEYSDLGCPNCARFHKTITDAVDVSQGSLVRVYRHFPVIRDFSLFGAVVSECLKNKLGDDVFFDFLSRAFSLNLNEPILEKLGLEYGLTNKEIEVCLSNKSKENILIQKYIQQASLVGIRGTPNGFIYNRKTGKHSRLFGAIPTSELKKIINGLK